MPSQLTRLLLGLLLAMATALPTLAQTIETSARQALLVDAGTGAVLLEKNADEPMPPSSMSKLMTVYAAFEALKGGRLGMEDSLPVSERAWRKQGSKMFVHVGDRVKVSDLLRGIIVQSGNDACIVVAEGLAGSEEAFAEQLTRRGRELGLTRSMFRNSTGWPEDGHVMTARDLALLSKRMIDDFPELYRMFAERDFTYGGIKQGNRNPLLYTTPGTDGLKTGHTEAAGYGLTGSVQREGRRLILVVNGLPSMKARAEETERLIEWGFREFDNYVLAQPGETVSEAEVWLGETEKVPLASAEKVVVTLPRKARDGVKLSAVYEGPVPAPIRRGDRVATLAVSAPGLKPMELPLVAAADVPKLGYFGRIAATVRLMLWK